MQKSLIDIYDELHVHSQEDETTDNRYVLDHYTCHYGKDHMKMSLSYWVEKGKPMETMDLIFGY